MINCVIITSEAKKVVYDGLRSILLPAYSGQMQILPGHAESFVVLKKGGLILRQSNRQDKTIQITKGEFYFKDNRAVIIL